MNISFPPFRLFTSMALRAQLTRALSSDIRQIATFIGANATIHCIAIDMQCPKSL